MRRISRLLRAYDMMDPYRSRPFDNDMDDNHNPTYELKVDCILFGPNDEQVSKGSAFPDHVSGKSASQLTSSDTFSILDLAKATYENFMGAPAPSGAYLDPSFDTGEFTVVDDYDGGGRGTFNLVYNGGSFYGEFELQ